MKKSVIAIGLAAASVFSGAANASMIFQPSAVQMRAVHQADRFCSVTVTKGNSGFTTPFMEQAAIPYERGEMAIQASFPARVTFAVDTDWVSTVPWGNEVPEYEHIVAPKDPRFGNATVVNKNGSDTGDTVNAEPNKDPMGNRYEFYTKTDDMFAAGKAEAVMTIQADCQPQV
ncbi:MAG: hypothetical protein ACRC2Y_04420 [Aeromonas veronii]